jgi:hypothetical protein
MTKLTFLQDHIYKTLVEENREREENHTSSGKLSASRLGDPIQWQMLHAIGVPGDAFDGFTLCKFKRGRHVEDFIRKNMPGIINKEKFVEYRNVVGYVDALVDMKDWNMDIGVIPHEIKSTTNAAFKWIKRDGAKEGHLMQGTLYALALGSDYVAVDYVASDDYRVESFLHKTTEAQEAVEKAIDEFNRYKEMAIVPVFEPKQKWQENIKYNSYSQWAELTQGQIMEKIEKDYPEAFKNLKGGAVKND